MIWGVEPWATPQPPKHFVGELAGEICPTIAHDDLWYPYMTKQLYQSHTAFAVNDFNIYTEGQRVQLSTTHRQYLWPCDDGGSMGPIQSIFMTWNGTSALVTGVIGTRTVVTGCDLR